MGASSSESRKRIAALVVIRELRAEVEALRAEKHMVLKKHAVQFARAHELKDALDQARAELASLRATVAAVEALADEWMCAAKTTWDQIKAKNPQSDYAIRAAAEHRDRANDLRAALNSKGDREPTDQQVMDAFGEQG